MMRRPLTTLVVVASCGVLGLGAGLAVAIEGGGGARVKAVAAEPLSRGWPVRMSAAPNDLTLAEAVFREPTRGQRIAGSSLHAGVEAPFGGLPHDSSFAQAIAGPPAAPSPAPPEISPPTPTPSSPAGKVPGEGCIPTPGYACPASSRGGARAPVPAGWGRTAAGAH